MSTADEPSSHLNFSKTQRIVLLIDLHPLLSLQNPVPYISAVNSAAGRLLRFSPLSSSLFAYKLFFSSLSSLRSAAILPPYLSTPSLSFNLPLQTLDSLSNTLISIPKLADRIDSPSRPRASYTASSLLQLIHDYAWEAESENLSGKNDATDGDFGKIPSNLVILFSPISSMIDCSADYLESREVYHIFSVVRDAFVNRDIHLSWIDVKVYESKNEGFEVKKNEHEEKSVVVKEGIRRIGWGFCSSDLIVLGPSLLPFGLIYPKIGVQSDFMRLGDASKRNLYGQLILEILDVNGMQLECKFCELEFVKVNNSSASIRSHSSLNALESSDWQNKEQNHDFILGRLGSGSLKLHVKAVHRCGKIENIEGSLGCFLVHERFTDSSVSKKNGGGEYITDRVLEMLHREMAGVTYRSQIPTWQILLSFLHMNGCCALVYIANSKGDTVVGTLKPLAAHLAVLSISDAGVDLFKNKSGSKLYKEDDWVCDTHGAGMNNTNRCQGSQTDTSTSGNGELSGGGKRKKSRRDPYQEMTWSSFYTAAIEGSNFDLFEVYTTRQNEKSKKLKFLKCWMKQISSFVPYCLPMLAGSKSTEELSASNTLSSVPSQVDEGVMPFSCSETSETFFKNLPNRIQQGLESGMDLQSLAERIINSSIRWLRHKFDSEKFSEGQPLFNADDSRNEAVARQLMELLLRAPKEMKKVFQNNGSSEEAAEPSPSTENIFKEYELQILLRMEILQSDVSPMIEESRKEKLLKHICSLLEIIQFLLPGGLHGHISLYDYAERTIRGRYSDVLEDVVKKIYTKLELLPFGDEDEAPSHLFNSEDSNQSWMDRHERYEKAESSGLNRSVSTEGDSSQPSANANTNLLRMGEDDTAHILNEAREKRERNRRFVSFTSWAPDFQRVWAPKQRNVATKGKFEPVRKKSRRKNREKPSYSVVCETPMTGNKRSFSRENNVGDEAGNSSSRSVSKALFQE